MKAACLLLVFCALPASAEPEFIREAGQEIEALRERAKPYMEESEQLRARIKQLQARYADPKDIDSLKEEREKVLQRMGYVVSKLDKVKSDLKLVRDRRRVALTMYQMEKLRQRETLDLKSAAWGIRLGGDLHEEITHEIDANNYEQRMDFQRFIPAEIEYKARRQVMRVALFSIAIVLCLSLLGFIIVRFIGMRKLEEINQAQAKAQERALAQARALAGPLDTGIVLDRKYRIERQIGKGGMGVVYQATDQKLGRKVAVKQLHAKSATDAKHLERLLSEARLVAALKHPNIVEIHAIVEQSGNTFLIFEFVSGETLSQRLSQEKTLDPGFIAAALKSIGDALDYSHAQKIIHRDLKPGNVMVTEEGVLKVMDFGIARESHRAREATSPAPSDPTENQMTQTMILGTPPYMAPEQHEGMILPETDLYALGIMTYQMLTGMLPFNGPNFRIQKKNRAYVPASRLNTQLPGSLDGFIDKALHPEPSHRFHSGGEMAEVFSKQCAA